MSEKEYSGFGLKPFDGNNISSQKGVKKLELTSGQKIQLHGLFNQIPSVIGTAALSNTYVLDLPKGVSVADLMQYKNGGLGTPYFGKDGKIAGHASIQAVETSAVAVAGLFTIMSIATSQYFLSEINSNLGAINQKVDKILEFLYGDKKAELMSEVNFVNYAYNNFSSIMSHSEQRTATIISLQEARKVAMKDIEFYMADLDSLIKTKDISNLDAFVNKAFQIKDCLQLAIQLYIMGSILEAYYAQNTESSYLRYIEKDIIMYIDKCEKKMLSNFSAIQMCVQSFKGGPLKKVDKSVYEEKISELVDMLGSGEELIKRKPLQSVLSMSKQATTYYINNNGELYLKTS